jgi:hypothetical protein
MRIASVAYFHLEHGRISLAVDEIRREISRIVRMSWTQFSATDDALT